MKSARFSAPLLLSFGFALLGVAALHAQLAPPPQRASTLFSAGVSYTSSDGQGAPKFPSIDLVFNLRQPNGAPIIPHPEELELYSEGQSVGASTGIRTFDRTGYGTSTVIALDANGALRSLTPNAVNLAVFTVVHDGVKQDTTAVTSLAEDFFVDLPFHPGPRTWKANAPLFPARGQGTHLYDGLLEAMSLFTPALPRRRILLVIADGHDSGSQHTPLDLLARAKSLGIEIDTFAIDPAAPHTVSASPTEATAALQQVSLATGGTYALAHNGDELQQMIALHLSDVRATPVAEFQLSDVPADGQVHALQLRWLTGHQSTPAFLTAPKEAASFSFRSLLRRRRLGNPLFSNPWILGFGGCFLVGLCLLLLSLIPSRKPLPTPQPSDTASDIFFKPPSGPIRQTSGTLKPPSGPYPPKPATAPRSTEAEKLAPTPRFDAPAQGPYARLILRSNALAGKVVPMTRPSFSLGSLPGNDLALAGDLTISSTHLRFYWENAILFVEDNHSTNGTWLNRQRIPAGRHPLKPGDEIGLGQTFLIVERA